MYVTGGGGGGGKEQHGAVPCTKSELKMSAMKIRSSQGAGKSEHHQHLVFEQFLKRCSNFLFTRLPSEKRQSVRQRIRALSSSARKR